MSDKHTVQEVADILHVNPETIKKHIRRVFPSKMQNGSKTWLDEAEITTIKSLIAPTTGVVGQVHTDLEMQRQAVEVMAWMNQKVQQLQAQIAEQQPKVEYFDTVAASKDAIPMSLVAKEISFPGIGRNKLFSILRELQILRRNNEPYQRYVDQGWFRVVEKKYETNSGEIKIVFQTLVHQKGIEKIIELLKSHGSTSAGNYSQKALPASSGAKK